MKKTRSNDEIYVAVIPLGHIPATDQSTFTTSLNSFSASGCNHNGYHNLASHGHTLYLPIAGKSRSKTGRLTAQRVIDGRPGVPII